MKLNHLKNINFSNFKTDKVINMEYMFSLYLFQFVVYLRHIF